MAASYEIIWAVARTPPSSGYFEPDDHPASTTAYTASDDIARMKSSPTLRSMPARLIIAVADVERRADRDHQEDEERRDQRRDRCDDVRPNSTLRGVIGSLKSSFEPVGQRLQDPERPGAVRPDPVLHVGDHLALEPHQQKGVDRPARRTPRPP